MLKINNIYQGSSLELLKQLDDNSIDSIVTDPPYELGFMGKSWDKTGIAYNVELWKECLRVLKHGGHLLAFGGTRTYHRMACAIEDAGFEIRDQIQWIYGSGFPKSHNISKAIDKKLGAEREVIGKREHPTLKNQPKVKSKAYHVETLESDKNKESWDITAPATDSAIQWDGWGTALKPANEPIVMARKPLSEKSVVDNVLTWGTGGINIDDCRVETDDVVSNHSRGKESAISKGIFGDSKEQETHQTKGQKLGRFPANIIFDEESGKLLDEQSGITKSGKVKENKSSYEGKSNTGFLRGVSNSSNQHGDSGGASRFFYCAKASKKDRGEGNTHPTVKPLKLMQYLVRLVTPENGIVLDPFSGSGTTLLAAKSENKKYIGFELNEEYIEIIENRLKDCEF
jgi:DNA modification methylase